MRDNLVRIIMCFLIVIPALLSANEFNFSGHTKYHMSATGYPENSYYNFLFGDESFVQTAEVRFKLNYRKQSLDLQADYQIIAQQGDISGANQGVLASLPVNNKTDPIIPLDWTIDESNDHSIYHRFDRLNLGIIQGDWVVRIGRQAISWGNGLSFQPMDLFNPFSPATVDTEYKTGDDMIYGQHLFSNGSDLQALVVVHQDVNTKSINSHTVSSAIKYHGFSNESEYDLLLAKNYNDEIVGAGFSTNTGEAAWRGDLTLTHTDKDVIISFTTNLSYAWNSWGHNFTGAIEYFYNGFGEPGRHYNYLFTNTSLLKRLQRGELFTVARHYFAASAVIEVTPLIQVLPSMFINLGDRSALMQLAANIDLSQNLQATLDIRLPVGPDDSEYGGLETELPGVYLSNQVSSSAQIAWYF